MIDLTIYSAGLMAQLLTAAAVAYGALFGVLWVVGRIRKGP